MNIDYWILPNTIASRTTNKMGLTSWAWSKCSRSRTSSGTRI